jgi:MFS family permease
MPSHIEQSKRNYLLLILISFTRFGGDAFFYSFLTRYLKTLNYSDIRLGILTALIPFMAVIGNLFMSKVATTYKKRRILFFVWSAVESLFIGLFAVDQNFYYVLFFVIICNFCSNSFYNLLDTFIVPITHYNGKTYANGRLFGSLAYVIGVILGGYSIKYLNYLSTFIIGACLMVAAGLLFIFVRFSSEQIDEIDREDDDESGKEPTYKEIFKNKNYIIYLIFVALLISAVWTSDNVFAQYTSYLQVPDDQYSYSYSAAIVMEATMLFSLSKVKKISWYKIFMYIGGAALILKCTIMAIPNLPNVVYLVFEGFRGVTYGMILTSNINLMTNILGKRLVYKGYFVAIACDELLAAIIDLAAPSIITATSYTVMFSIEIGMVVLALIFLSFVKISEVPQATTALKEESKAVVSK